MNDINWRSVDDPETWEKLSWYPMDQVLVETDLGEGEVAYRVDKAKNVVKDRRFGPWLSTACERVMRIAFI